MKQGIYKQQENMVCKHNDIVQKGRFALTMQQNKMLLFLISQIKPGDDANTVYRISIRDYCRVCGIEEDSGKNVNDAKNAIQQIADKSIWIKKEGKKESLLRWFNQITYNDRTKLFEVTFHKDMIPYLYDLKFNYVQYRLENVLVLKSQYSIRLYELLKSYQFMRREVGFTIEELKIRLNAKNYERFADFKRRVLDIAVEDINRASDICVSYRTYKGAERSVQGVWFRIDEPNIFEKIAKRAVINEKLVHAEENTDEKTDCPEESERQWKKNVKCKNRMTV